MEQGITMATYLSGTRFEFWPQKNYIQVLVVFVVITGQIKLPHATYQIPVLQSYCHTTFIIT